MNSTAFTDRVTPLLITFNEEANIARTLEKLSWAKRIVVVDSGSTDATLEIISRYPQVDRLHRAFDSFAEQCNFGLTQVRTDWVLSLDADYELSDELLHELHDLRDTNDVAGYRASFVYRIYGRPLRGSLYPSRTVLHLARAARYVNDGHGHRVIVSGEVKSLRGVIYHDDRKPLSRWFSSQQHYARSEAAHLLQAQSNSLSRTDRLRRMAWPAPILVFLYVLLFKGCVLDGWPGWFYAFQRLLAECMIALELIEQRLSGGTDGQGNWRKG